VKRKRFSEEHIVTILKQAETGRTVPELSREHGVSDGTFYNWRRKYSGLELSDLKKLRALEDENRRLKMLVADQALDIQALRDVVKKSGERVGSPRGGHVFRANVFVF
jgi:putative transposase